MLDNMKIGVKLTGGFLIVAAFVALTGALGLVMISHVGHWADVIYEEEFKVDAAARDMLAAQADQTADVYAALLGNADARSDFKESGLAFDSAVGRMSKLPLVPQETERLNRAVSSHKDFMTEANRLLTASRDAAAPDTKELTRLARATEKDVRDLVAGVEADMERAMKSADAAESSSYWLLLGAVAVAVALAIIAGAIVTRNITVRLARLTEDARALGAGDLRREVGNTAPKDELGDLARSFQEMTSRLREQIRQMNEGTGVLASAVGEISASVTQLASSSSETASAVAETTTTVEEVKQTSQVATQKAREVSEGARRTVEISRKGESAAHLTQQEIDRIRRQMELVGESIVKLSEQSQAIAEIISSVDDIAEQSNLLAVNAAIEAAKAGEQGRGFAIVAQEIRNLAEQSKQSTARVRAILGDIQKATSGAVLATEQGAKAVDAGVKQAGEAGEAIRALSESVGEAAQAAAQIAASSQQQYAGVDQVTRAMENIKQAAGQNAESSRQLEASARNLREVGERLQRLSSQYRT